MRFGASPGAAVVIQRMVMSIDVRDVLPAILMLVAYREFMRGEAVYVAERIPNARRVEITGPDTLFWVAEGLGEEICSFARSVWGEREPETVLATILFTDIVGSTERLWSWGDRAWAERSVTMQSFARSWIDSAAASWTPRGTGSSPRSTARSARSAAPPRSRTAFEISDSRCERGRHTGECETVGEKLGGIAVNIGARVAAKARAGEVLVSSTVKDLVAGSGLAFEDRGRHELKGIPGEWQLYAVER